MKLTMRSSSTQITKDVLRKPYSPQSETAGIQRVATTSAVMQIKGAEPDEHHPESLAVQTCGWVPNT